MTNSGRLLEAARLLREYAASLSYDADRLRARASEPDDDTTWRTLAHLESQIGSAYEAAEDLAALDPSTVDAAPSDLEDIRAVAKYLVHQLEQIESSPAARRAFGYVKPRRHRLNLVPSSYRVVAYLRVSTDRQADEGFGLEVQEAAIREWARAARAKVVEVVRDEGKSGAADVIDRPGLAKALGHIQAGRADAVVVARVDRLARDLVLSEWIRAEIIRAGGDLRSASNVEDAHLRDDPDPAVGLVRQVLAAVAEYERKMVRLRMESGKEAKRRAGGYAAGQPRYGYRAADHELVPDMDEQRIAAKMKRWRREGKSLRWIADRLNEEGVPARRGKWHPQTVSRVVDAA